jgi:hypothetical protein
MPLNNRIIPYGQHYSDSDMRSAAKPRHPPHLSHPNFNGIEIASHSFLAGSLPGVRLLRVTCEEPVKVASLCMIRRLGDFGGGHLQGDF